MVVFLAFPLVPALEDVSGGQDLGALADVPDGTSFEMVPCRKGCHKEPTGSIKSIVVGHKGMVQDPKVVLAMVTRCPSCSELLLQCDSLRREIGRLRNHV